MVCSEQRSDKGQVVVIRCDPMRELMYPGSLWLGQVTVDEDNLRVWWRHQG